MVSHKGLGCGTTEPMERPDARYMVTCYAIKDHQSCISFKQGSKFCNSLSKTLGWSDLDCWWGPSKCGYANMCTCTSTVWAKVSLLSSSQQLLAPALSTGYWLCKSGWIMINCRSCIRLASISPHLSSSSLSKRKHLQNFTFDFPFSKMSETNIHQPTHPHPSTWTHHSGPVTSS